MYEFHYEKIRKWYGDKASLLFTDTDSFCYKLETNDLYKDLRQHKSHFDFSGYPTNHELYSARNKKVIGKWKDELNGRILTQFIGLSAKMYSMMGQDFNLQKAKGVKKNVIRQNLRHSVFKRVLRRQSKLFCEMKFIRSYRHTVYSVKVRKTGMHAFDSKRYILKDGVSTLSYGHYRISK